MTQTVLVWKCTCFATLHPIFGGKPEFFFGRDEILSHFDAALINRGSEDRTLFVTGKRESGKTALLEQLSQRANVAGWLYIDQGFVLLPKVLRTKGSLQSASPPRCNTGGNAVASTSRAKNTLPHGRGLSTSAHQKFENGKSNPGKPVNPRLSTIIALVRFSELELWEPLLFVK